MQILGVAECIICERVVPVVLRIGPAWCCAECEQRMMEADAGTEDYEELMRGLRRLWEALAVGYL